jgi:hypothetical protein
VGPGPCLVRRRSAQGIRRHRGAGADVRTVGGSAARDQILAACRSEVTAAYTSPTAPTAPTDDGILAALRCRPEPPQPLPTPSGRPAPWRTRDPRDDDQVDDAFDRGRRSAIVDDWLAQRGQASD